MKIRGAIMDKSSNMFSKKVTEIKVLLLGGKTGELSIIAPTELLSQFNKNDEIELEIEKK